MSRLDVSSSSSFVDEIIANIEECVKEDKKRDVLVSFEEDLWLTNWSFDAFQYVKKHRKKKEDFRWLDYS